MMDYVIGIDGGGTKTELSACGFNGNMLYEKTLPGSNVYASSTDEVGKNIGELLGGCIRALKVYPKAVCMGAAGMIGEYAERTLKNAICVAARCDSVIVCTDAKISLKANFANEPGVSITAGTGSICVGQNARGKMFRVAGWGHLFSDEGSAYDIVRNALIAVTKSHDGMAEKTLLTDKFLFQTHSRSYEQLVHKIYREYADKASLASLAPVVVQCASEGDCAATGILETAAQELFQMCGALIDKAGLAKERFGVCFNGGVLKNSRQVRCGVTAALSGCYDCDIKEITQKAVLGAIKMAFEACTSHLE